MKLELKACKKCKMLTSEKTCPDHPDEKLTSEWYGFIFIQNVAESVIARETGITKEGRYAIKVRQ
ncbi:MAG: DNA-directed RNA polymerase subunit E'' [Candidatus Thermoplasmatota archaeon]|jgi:DNA-directed RNA polymerase subunit E"|nr:DNA-directed RNA polymerase subunit E'' [Candidatus Thermoplasmatota archaeon]MCL5800906.1 DNA-directed RNA polymerase subunit E'' [Candidatus Thermoplasmatota archaeon]